MSRDTIVISKVLNKIDKITVFKFAVVVCIPKLI